jgi:hypothetical protein
MISMDYNVMVIPDIINFHPSVPCLYDYPSRKRNETYSGI